MKEFEQREDRPPRTRLEEVVPRSAPFTVMLEPCGACNFKCGFCPCNMEPFQAAERHKMMSWDLFSKAAEDLKAFAGQVRAINIWGFGEPLLNPRIADMVYELKRLDGSPEVRITTNASLLNEKMSQELIAAGLDRIIISAEALSSEAYQKFCGVNVNFEDIVKNVENFYRLSRGTDSRITVKIFMDTLEGEFGEKLFYQIFAPISDYHYIERIEENWPEFESGKPEMPSTEDPADGDMRCYRPGVARGICAFPFTDISIRSNGAVCVCCVDWKFATQYGDINKEHLSEIWNGEKHVALQRTHLEHLTGKLLPFCAVCRRKSKDQIKDPALLLRRLKQLQ